MQARWPGSLAHFAEAPGILPSAALGPAASPHQHAEWALVRRAVRLREATCRGVYSDFQGNPSARLPLGLRPPSLPSPCYTPRGPFGALCSGSRGRPGSCCLWASAQASKGPGKVGTRARPSDETQVSAFHAPLRLPSPTPGQRNYRRLPPYEPFPGAAERNTISGCPNYKRP